MIRVKALNDERVDMVKRHVPPPDINEVTREYLKAYAEAFGHDPDMGGRDSAEGQMPK